MSDDPYVYPGTTILRNRFGLTDPADLDRIERLHSANRGLETMPRGAFDLTHLRAIHRHLFQDIYDWAGELRTVEISKGSQQFQFRRYIETGMADVHGRLVRSRFLKGLSAAAFAQQAAVIVGDINYSTPSARGTAVPRCTTSNSLPVRRVMRWTRPKSPSRNGLRHRFRAMRETMGRWRQSSGRP